jgi:hypothetical protein
LLVFFELFLQTFNQLVSGIKLSLKSLVLPGFFNELLA